MIRTTTPTHTFTLPIDTATCDEIQLTYKQYNNSLVKHYQDGVLPEGMTLDGFDVIQVLTQKETSTFRKGKVKAQIRVLTKAGKALTSQQMDIDVNETLNEEILK